MFGHSEQWWPLEHDVAAAGRPRTRQEAATQLLKTLESGEGKGWGKRRLLCELYGLCEIIARLLGAGRQSAASRLRLRGGRGFTGRMRFTQFECLNVFRDAER